MLMVVDKLGAVFVVVGLFVDMVQRLLAHQHYWKQFDG